MDTLFPRAVVSSPSIRVVQSPVENADALIHVDEHGIILDANSAAEELLGRGALGLIGEPFGIPVIAGSKVEIEIARDNRLRRGEMFVSELVIGDKVTFHVRIVDVTESWNLLAELRHSSEHDSHTGLCNRRKLLDVVNAATSEHAEPFAVIYIDLDDFKVINDTLGHAGGDAALWECARRLKRAIQSVDLPARVGGDEFVLFCPSVESRRKAIALMSRVKKSLARPFEYAGRSISISGSIGMALFPEDGQSAESLLARADEEMYRAKASKKEVHGEDHSICRYELERAISAGEIRAIYQPQMPLLIGQRPSVEALCCWDHPILGTIRAGSFIDSAKKWDLVAAIDKVVFRQACEAAASWRRAGLPIERVSVNFSNTSLDRADLLPWVESVLASTHIDPAMLEVEIPEDLEIRAQVEQNLGGLRDLGLCLAIDDFCAGATSIHWLSRLKVDTLKLDRSLIHGCESDQIKQTIIASLVHLANGLGLRIISEGVETSEQLEIVRRLKCDGIQGFCISDALAESDLQVFVKAMLL